MSNAPRVRVAFLITISITAAAAIGETLRSGVAAERARPLAPRIERARFLARPTLRSVALAPNGRSVAWLQDDGANRALWLQSASGGIPRRILANTTAGEIFWTRDSRWLLLETKREVFAMAMAGQTGSGIIATLGGRSKREFVRVDSSLPAAMLLLERPPVVSRQAKRWRLFRIDMRGKQTLLREDDKPIVDEAFDPNARLAFLLRAEGEREVIHRVDSSGQLIDAIPCDPTERIEFLATMREGRELLLIARAGGNFERLLKLTSSNRFETLHEDPRAEADVRELVLDPVTQSPEIATYGSTVAATYGLNEGARRLVDVIHARFPGRSLRIQIGHGDDAWWLVRERSATLRGERLYLLDPRTSEFRELIAESGPPESAMARKISFSWRASDGMQLFGFVTIPPGVDASHAPLVVSVHGGPFSAVRPDFSNDAQFLANRGYVVFQPNFRGSTAHGRNYMHAAKGDFGNGRVQMDIVEGVRFLLAHGIGDCERVGIVGASFGGYSALLGVTFQPDLFKVGIAAVPPGDFGWVIREYARTGVEMFPGIPMAASMRALALDPSDKAIAARLTSQSPTANASRMARPLLVLAGGEDERVPIRGVLDYVARLKTLQKDVTLYVDADAGHNIDDGVTREAYYYLMEVLLHRHLGGGVPEPPSREVLANIRHNMRLAGRDLAAQARVE